MMFEALRVRHYAPKVHTRDLLALEGRLLEQGGQVQAAGTDLAALQRKMAEEKGDIQVRREEVR